MTTAIIATQEELAFIKEQGRMAFHRGDLLAPVMNDSWREMTKDAEIGERRTIQLAEAFTSGWLSEQDKKLMADFPEMYA